ncbi:MAG TPA: efflux RND transporter periplasmic adaptor subunit [Steroidobacteraceae bacterium]|nr:efflux RND transporter periplasmic adaptor subunit [Steroidobacteraceae bacterium]
MSGRLAGVLGVLLVLLSACGKQQGGAMSGFAPQVTVVTLKAGPVALTRELPGRTSAYLISEVRPQVNGIVKRRLFTEGAYVKAGQSLYEIDDALYQAQYQNAQATLQKAQAGLQVAQLAANRAAELVKQGLISKQDNDNAVAALGQARADVAAGEAAVATAKVNLNYAHIESPISGRIGGSSVTPGALVTANQATALATVTQLDPIYVDVNQSSSEWLSFKREVEAGRVQARGSGTPAKIVLQDGSEYSHEGKLQFADVTVDPSTGNLMLRVVVPNPDGLLMPGMYVRAVVNEGVLPNGVLAPQQGVTRDPKGAATALVVDKDNKVELRNVRVSRTVGDQWLVEDGLAAGDRVIVEGVQKVQPGMSVNPVEAGTQSSEAATAGNH